MERLTRGLSRLALVCLCIAVVLVFTTFHTPAPISEGSEPTATIEPTPQPIPSPILEAPEPLEPPQETPDDPELAKPEISSRGIIASSELPFEHLTYQITEPPEWVYWSPVDEEVWGEAATYMAKTIWGEASGCGTTQRAAIGWAILNRVDEVDEQDPDTIIQIIQEPHQFYYYSWFPLEEEIYDLALDVLSRWQAEKHGWSSVGRVLPPEYKWYSGDGTINHFRNAWKYPYQEWDFSWDSPYDD